MYESLGQRGDVKLLVGARARQMPVEAHVGRCRDFLRRHEQAAAEAVRHGRRGLEDIGPHLLQRTADTRNLRAAWDHLAQHGGQAPGPNGLTYSDLDQSEVWELLRTLRSAIQSGTYRHGPDRPVNRPKSSGSGYRTLRLENIADRVVARGVVQIVQPLLDPLFDERSYGFRPNRDRRHALAEAMQLADSGYLVWVVEDIQDAFDHVPLRRLLDIVRKSLPSAEPILALIERIVNTGTKRGLRQGNALSPLLLNLYLDHHLDRTWRRRFPDTPLLRTADDPLIVCRTEAEARNAHAQLREILLPTGMRLKGTPDSAICDLHTGDHADWLGYDVSWGIDGLEVRTAEKAWRKLARELEEAHEHPASPLRARRILEGWTDQLGPTYPYAEHDQVYARVTALFRESAFDEAPDEPAFEWRRWGAYARWLRLLDGLPGRDVPTSLPLFPGGSACHVLTAPEARRSDGAPAGAPSLSFSADLACDETVTLYADGCCDRLTNEGGWAVLLEAAGFRRNLQGSGYLARTTNNRAELIAVINGLKQLPATRSVEIVSDSEYVLLGISERLPEWKSRGWRAGSGRHKRPLQNADLWRRLDDLLAAREVACTWVRGHAGHQQNEDCDRRARRAMERGPRRRWPALATA